jgi:autoinducer 2-degrading protein
MFIVVVRAEVKPECVDAFVDLATHNAAESRKEPGNVRFDVLRSAAEPTKFAFYEVYHDEEALKAHQQTAHYARWKAENPALLASPRVSEKYLSVAPDPWA